MGRTGTVHAIGDMRTWLESMGEAQNLHCRTLDFAVVADAEELMIRPAWDKISKMSGSHAVDACSSGVKSSCAEVGIENTDRCCAAGVGSALSFRAVAKCSARGSRRRCGRRSRRRCRSAFWSRC